LFLETIMSWTAERVELLRSLWSEGRSASVIAARLGSVTRNAVIGKVHRLRLSGHGTPSRRSAPSRRKRSAYRANARPIRKSPALPAASRPSREAALELLGPAPAIPVTAATLTAELCRWPEGDPKQAGFHFCGRPKAGVPGPYCGAHAAIAYR
jgi:GcrA cell cycle regulator